MTAETEEPIDVDAMDVLLTELRKTQETNTRLNRRLSYLEAPLHSALASAQNELVGARSRMERVLRSHDRVADALDAQIKDCDRLRTKVVRIRMVEAVIGIGVVAGYVLGRWW